MFCSTDFQTWHWECNKTWNIGRLEGNTPGYQ